MEARGAESGGVDAGPQQLGFLEDLPKYKAIRTGLGLHISLYLSPKTQAFSPALPVSSPRYLSYLSPVSGPVLGWGWHLYSMSPGLWPLHCSWAQGPCPLPHPWKDPQAFPPCPGPGITVPTSPTTYGALTVYRHSANHATCVLPDSPGAFTIPIL